MTETFTRTPRTLLEQRRNRVSNPRGWGGTTGYAGQTPSATPAVTVLTTAAAPVSSRALRLTLPGASAWWQINFRPSPEISVVPGTVYTLSAYGRASVAATTRAQINWTVDGSYHSTSDGAASAQAANVWDRRSVTATAPAGVNGAYLTYRADTAGNSGNTLDVTGLLFEAAAALGTFFDGGSTDAPPWYYRWVGAADASESTANILNPADITTPDSIDGYSADSDPRTVTRLSATTDDMYVTVLPAGPRTGSYKLAYDDVAAAQAAEQLFRTGSMFTFTNTAVPSIGMLFAPTGARIRCEQDPTRAGWFVTVPFTEVPA